MAHWSGIRRFWSFVKRRSHNDPLETCSASGSSASRSQPAVRAVHQVSECDGLRNPAQVSLDVQLRRNVLFKSVLLFPVMRSMRSLFGIHFLFPPAYNEPVFVAEF